MKLNKKGGLFDIFIVLIIIFIAFLFFASWIYGFGILTNELIDIPQPSNSAVNYSNITRDTFQQVDSSLPTLKWIALVMFIAMFLGILVSNFLVKAHPVFFIVYILIVVVAIIFSAYLSNAYEDISQSNNPIASTLQSFGAMDFIMLNLPFIITIFGIVGAIFLFIGIRVDADSGGGIPI